MESINHLYKRLHLISVCQIAKCRLGRLDFQALTIIAYLFNSMGILRSYKGYEWARDLEQKRGIALCCGLDDRGFESR